MLLLRLLALASNPVITKKHKQELASQVPLSALRSDQGMSLALFWKEDQPCQKIALPAECTFLTRLLKLHLILLMYAWHGQRPTWGYIYNKTQCA